MEVFIIGIFSFRFVHKVPVADAPLFNFICNMVNNN